MKAGLLTERIYVLESKITTSEFGENETNWIVKYSTLANTMVLSQSRSTINNEILYDTTVLFKIRIYHKISEWDRIRWKSKQYRIISIIPDKNKQLIEILTELVNE